MDLDQTLQGALQTICASGATEVQKLMKMQFILRMACDIKPEETNNKELGNAINLLNIQEYMDLDDGDTTLSLPSLDDVKLSYLERKALKNALITNLQIKLKSLAPLNEKLRADAAYNAKSEPSIKTLETKRRELSLKLAETKNRKCGLMKKIAEIKLGPEQHQKLELLDLDSQINDVKADLLEKHFTNHFLSRSSGTLKALSEIEPYMNKEHESGSEAKAQ